MLLRLLLPLLLVFLLLMLLVMWGMLLCTSLSVVVMLVLQ